MLHPQALAVPRKRTRKKRVEEEMEKRMRTGNPDQMMRGEKGRNRRKRRKRKVERKRERRKAIRERRKRWSTVVKNSQKGRMTNRARSRVEVRLRGFRLKELV